jgi:crotonobetainyl-CoA:carnitine CoA-transferase CaiB-like acyl-CoA transferase
MPQPLEGIRVLDWTIWQQGPVASKMLGDMGADVIKIETPDGGDPGRALGTIAGQSLADRPAFYFETCNRNKRSITIDLKQEAGRQIVYELAAKSDVFVQNFRKGVAGRLGIGYEDLRAHNEKLIYANATGYGPNGPDSGDPSFDHLGLARSGIMLAAGEPDMEPLSIQGGVADQIGAIMLAYGVMTALVARERFGMGQEINASHLGSMSYVQNLSLASRLINGAAFPRMRRSQSFNPIWNHYRCQDDKWLALAHLQADRYWGDFCRAIGRPDLITDERFADMGARGKNGEACVAILDEVFATKPRAEWLDILRKGGDFIFTVVNSVDDLADDPQMTANDYVVEFEHPSYGPTQVVGIPVGLSETPGSVREPSPELGQHTELILTDLLGYDWDRIAALREQKVI